MGNKVSLQDELINLKLASKQMCGSLTPVSRSHLNPQGLCFEEVRKERQDGQVQREEGD